MFFSRFLVSSFLERTKSLFVLYVLCYVWMRTQRSSLTESSRGSLTESSVRTHESLYTLAAPGPVKKDSVMSPRRVVTRRP
jgi:hypothetical protein